MQTWPLNEAEKGLIAFEVSNVLLTPSAVARRLRRIAGVSQVQVRPLFSSQDAEVHVRFQYQGQDCVVWEPYGDSSRYWIGPADAQAQPTASLAALEQAFRQQAGVLQAVFKRLGL
ncbi:hypothetical protein V8J88_07850 [Massilia sp. W12]|uniref:hypothetical protein n=1 Tax=Massilia sp. W12 TaxID=3126507 RepID=UPI0030CE1249